MTTRTHYEVLGLAPGADGAMVDQAYWHLAKTYQQLAPQDPRAEQLLDELNEAYGILGTPRLREEYDAEMRLSSQPGRTRLVPRRVSESTGKGLKFSLPRLPFMSRDKTSPEEASVRPRTVVAATSRISGRDKTQDLHASTAAMLARWRNNAGIQPAAELTPEPDMTLVDIFRSERELESAADPLTSVMDVLRRQKAPAAE
jgi:curved DNA-binding protein CbpA